MSSTISFPCPSCGKTIKATERHAGRKGQCPNCSAGIVVPQTSADDSVSSEQSDDVSALKSANTEITPPSIGQDRVLIVAGAAVACSICLMVAAIVLARGGDGETAPNTSVAATARTAEPAAVPETYTVSGGAWLTRQSGNSELIRGLRVYLLPAEISQRAIDSGTLRAAIGIHTERVKELRKEVLAKGGHDNGEENQPGLGVARLIEDLRLQGYTRDEEYAKKVLERLDKVEHDDSLVTAREAFILFIRSASLIEDPEADDSLDQGEARARQLWEKAVEAVSKPAVDWVRASG